MPELPRREIRTLTDERRMRLDVQSQKQTQRKPTTFVDVVERLRSQGKVQDADFLRDLDTNVKRLIANGKLIFLH